MGLPRATGYSPSYMNYLVFSSRKPRPFWMRNLVQPWPIREHSRFQIHICTSESPLTFFYLVSLSIQVPQIRGWQCCSIVLSFNNNSSNLALGFIQMHRIPFLSASFGLGLEMREEGEEGVKIRDNHHSIRLLDQRLRRMGFYLLIHWGGLFQMRLGTIDNTTTSTMTRTLQMRLVKVLKTKFMSR